MFEELAHDVAVASVVPFGESGDGVAIEDDGERRDWSAFEEEHDATDLGLVLLGPWAGFFDVAIAEAAERTLMATPLDIVADRVVNLNRNSHVVFFHRERRRPRHSA